MIKLKSLILESPAGDELATVYGEPQKGGSVSKGQQQLSKIIGDKKVQAILKAGQKDGDKNDDKLPYSRIDALPVVDLQPTQREIGFDQSVLNLLTDPYKSLESFLKGKANVGGPIVTYAGKYIIDGHHRWSQVFAANPKATLLSLDIQAKPGFSHTDVLKAVHGAIAADIGKVPAANPEGVNLLKGVSLNDIPIDKLSNKAYKIWQRNSPINQGNVSPINIRGKQNVAQAIFQNLKFMIKKGVASGAPGRKYMPQSDSGGNPIDRLGDLAKGTINIQEPFGEGATLKDRFQKIANIKKSK